MAVYFITGKLGCGKTLCCVGKIRDYLEQGRRVATNLDINMTALSKPDSMATLIRVPDKPSELDLQAIGIGCEEEDESRYGLLVLDELGTWFNSRNWRDKGRGEVIDWFLHARKKHWDVYLIVQSMDSLDGQLVNALCEHLVICKRTDRLTIPIIGPILKTIGLQAILPKIHIAKVYYGQTISAMAVDRWWYRGRDLYAAYNTAQIFDDESHAIHSPLPAYYLNNIQLINHHKGQIKKLTVADQRLKSPPTSMKTAAIIACTVIMMAVSYRTYSKYTEFGDKAVIPVISQVQPDKLENVQLQVSSPQIDNPVQLVEDDHIKIMTLGKQVEATSYYLADGRINAVLHTDDGEIRNTFTLDDARAAGYIVILHGANVEVRRKGYYFTFVTKTDLSVL